MDGSGYARGTLAPRAGMRAAVPAMDPRPLLSMSDMGMREDMDMARAQPRHEGSVASICA